MKKIIVAALTIAAVMVPLSVSATTVTEISTQEVPVDSIFIDLAQFEPFVILDARVLSGDRAYIHYDGWEIYFTKAGRYVISSPYYTYVFNVY